MSLAMTITWFLVGIFGWPFAAVASVVLTIAWFVQKNFVWLLLLVAVILVALIFFLFPEVFERVYKILSQTLELFRSNSTGN